MVIALGPDVSHGVLLFGFKEMLVGSFCVYGVELQGVIFCLTKTVSVVNRPKTDADLRAYD